MKKEEKERKINDLLVVERIFSLKLDPLFPLFFSTSVLWTELVLHSL
jgi:hypothetical protein